LAIHIPRIWNSLQDVRAAITGKQQKSTIESMLVNSNYCLAKSRQVLLTSGSGSGKSNLRCYYLSVKQLEKRGLLEEVISKAREYENGTLAGND
jgi:energy-coupling factor transporter ATP-binding protein EcfA2